MIALQCKIAVIYTDGRLHFITVYIFNFVYFLSISLVCSRYYHLIALFQYSRINYPQFDAQYFNNSIKSLSRIVISDVITQEYLKIIEPSLYLRYTPFCGNKRSHNRIRYYSVINIHICRFRASARRADFDLISEDVSCVHAYQ